VGIGADYRRLAACSPKPLTALTLQAPSKIRLPAEVLPSQEENDIGLLNMAHAVTGICSSRITLSLIPDIRKLERLNCVSVSSSKLHRIVRVSTKIACEESHF